MNRLPGAALTVLSLALLLVASAAAYAQSAVDRIKSRGMLVVATDPGWPPMSWRNALLHKIRDGAPFRIVGAPLTFTPGSLVVERGEDALAAALKEIIEAMQKDGTLTRL